MIDKEVADGVDPSNIFVCGFSQGGRALFFPAHIYISDSHIIDITHLDVIFNATVIYFQVP